MSGIELNKNGLPLTLKLPCIYEIVNLITGDRYIGSSWTGSTRFRSHWTNLKKNKHTNIHLQNAWNKYGIGAFQLSYLRTFRPEEMTREALYTLEQDYIDYYKPIYNIAKKVDRPTTTPEQRRKMSENKSKEYIVTDPNGKELKILGLRPFCRANGLDHSAMTRVLKGEWSNHRGWKVRRIGENALIFKDKRFKHLWIVTNPNGKITKVKNLKSFCLQWGLIASNMRQVAQGRGQTHRGWACCYQADKE